MNFDTFWKKPTRDGAMKACRKRPRALSSAATERCSSTMRSSSWKPTAQSRTCRRSAGRRPPRTHPHLARNTRCTPVDDDRRPRGARRHPVGVDAGERQAALHAGADLPDCARIRRCLARPAFLPRPIACSVDRRCACRIAEDSPSAAQLLTCLAKDKPDSEASSQGWGLWLGTGETIQRGSDQGMTLKAG